MDPRQVTDYRLLVSNQEIAVKLAETTPQGNFVFEVPGAPYAGERARGEICFTWERQKYFIPGRVYYHPPTRIVFIPDTDFKPDRRAEARVETQALPANLTELKKFRKKTVPVSVIDLSSIGARVETHFQLDQELKYTLETELKFGHFSEPFQAVVQIRNAEVKRNLFLYGLFFEEISADSRVNLKKYLDRVTGKSGKVFLTS